MSEEIFTSETQEHHSKGRHYSAQDIMMIFDNTEVAFEHKSDFDLNGSYLLFRMMNNVVISKLGTALTDMAFQMMLPVDFFVKYTLFRQFCGGETLQECEETVEDLANYNIQSILDYSSEGMMGEQGLDRAASSILETLEYAKSNESVPFIVFKPSGIIRFELLEWLSTEQELNASQQAEYHRAKRRFKLICKSAHDADIPVMVDAEESWIQPAIDKLTKEMMAEFNTKKCIVYGSYQMYLSGRLDVLKADDQEAKKEGYYLGVKLVRGAYMTKENKRAEERGYVSPIQPSKEETDKAFDKALDFCTMHFERIALCAGTHNEQSVARLVELIQLNQIPIDHPHVIISQLYGMGDHISYNMAKLGFQVAKYVPYGPVKAVMPYLLRRAEENASLMGHVSRELRLLDTEMTRRNLPH